MKECALNVEMFSDNDAVNPQHYKGDIECIDAMRYVFGDKFTANGCLWNVFKYLWRYADKNGEEDIEKAKWYMNKFKMLINLNADKILKDMPSHQ